MADSATGLALDVAVFRRWMAELNSAIDRGCDELTRLDAAIGDADHGVNMLRGTRAVIRALQVDGRDDSPAGILTLAGSCLVSEVGGAAGPLYGMAFRSMGQSLHGVESPRLPDLVNALTSGLDAIRRMGAAEPGDKTIVDAWGPAVVALGEAPGRGLRPSLMAAEEAARAGMQSTIPMRARKGRASYLGWRSEGHQDPGATSACLVFSSLAAALD